MQFVWVQVVDAPIVRGKLLLTSNNATLSLPGGMFLEVLEGRGILIGFSVFHIYSLSQRVIYNNRLGIGFWTV